MQTLSKTKLSAVRFQTALQTGISAASLCINRRLAAIASSQSISVSQRRKRVNFWVDIGCGIGLPVMVMCTSYIIQGRRFLIWEGYGCEFAGTSTIPTFFILLLWPLLLSATSAVYGGTWRSSLGFLQLTPSQGLPSITSYRNASNFERYSKAQTAVLIPANSSDYCVSRARILLSQSPSTSIS